MNNVKIDFSDELIEQEMESLKQDDDFRFLDFFIGFLVFNEEKTLSRVLIENGETLNSFSAEELEQKFIIYTTPILDKFLLSEDIADKPNWLINMAFRSAARISLYERYDYMSE